MFDSLGSLVGFVGSCSFVAFALFCWFFFVAFVFFRCADDDDATTTNRQRQLYDEFLHALNAHPAAATTTAERGALLRDAQRINAALSGDASDALLATHCSNSAGLLTLGAAACSAARVGIALYGLEPTPARSMTSGTTLAPALSWRATVTQVRCVPHAGAGVSYSHVYRTTSDNEWLATIAVGYADGFRRTSGNRVVIGGALCDVVGRVTMDQIVARLPAALAPRVRIGDAVELIGARRSAADVAAAWNTIDYDVVCAIGKRVARAFVVDPPAADAR